jgi:hypothetical protein
VGGALVPRMSPRKGASHIPIVLFVNSLAGSAYGSPSLDCCQPLHRWPGGVVGIQRDPSAARTNPTRSFSDAGCGAGCATGAGAGVSGCAGGCVPRSSGAARRPCSEQRREMPRHGHSPEAIGAFFGKVEPGFPQKMRPLKNSCEALDVEACDNALFIMRGRKPCCRMRTIRSTAVANCLPRASTV